MNPTLIQNYPRKPAIHLVAYTPLPLKDSRDLACDRTLKARKEWRFMIITQSYPVATVHFWSDLMLKGQPA